MEDDSLVEPRTVNSDDHKIKLYKRRWFILFIYSINSLANALLFTTVCAMNDIASKYYNVSPNVIDWSGNSFNVVYIVIALPSAYFMTLFGLRLSMLLASSLNAIAACLHFAGYQRHGFAYVMGGQIAAALAVSSILQIPARLSTVWFGKDEHSKATSIGLFCNIFGSAVGYLQPTHMVPKSNNMDEVGKGMFNLFLSQLIFLLVCLTLTYLFFEDKPPLPPSFAASYSVTTAKELNLPFFKSIKILFTDSYFNLLTQAYGLYFGMYTFFTICLNQMVNSKITDSEIGWMGFSIDCIGILGVILNGYILDKYRCYRLMGMVIIFGSTALWTVFTFTLMHTNSELGIFISYSCLGLFGIPFFSSGVEQAAEMTYPISEGTSSAIIILFGNLYGFVFILLLGSLVDKGKIALVSYITIGIYALSFILICTTKMKMKRQEAEEKQGEKDMVICGSDDDSRLVI